MTGLLKSPQHHQLHHAADVQTRGGRIKADVNRLRPGDEQLGQPRLVGALMNQAAPSEFIEEVGFEA